MADWDPREDAWFAGFADGEGCFKIECSDTSGRKRCFPRFAISLRADDVDVLEALQKAFGGGLCLEREDRDNQAPCYRWWVASKREMAGLVAYFDRFPLRAKKARDYALWRQAVSIYCTASGLDPRLPVLRDALMTRRLFTTSDMDEPDSDDPFEVQLALGIED